MALVNLRSDERIGLALAVALHAALVAVLLWRPAVPPPLPAQRISVTLSPDTAPLASAPTHADAAADMEPTPGTPPPGAAPAPVVSPAPVQIAAPPAAGTAPEPDPLPRPPPLPADRPLPARKPTRAPKPVAVTRPQPTTVTTAEPATAPARPAPAKPRHPRTATPQDPPSAASSPPAKATARPAPSVKDWSMAMPAPPDRQPAGASRIGNDFLKGVSGGKAGGKASQQGAAVIGADVKSALSGAIAHQLKPHWLAPEGADADQLVTILSWDLNRDGSLAGPPRVVRQEGITDSNRPQAARHAEQAIRAVQLGAPFKLPADYYDAWKHVRSFEFNRTLSQ